MSNSPLNFVQNHGKACSCTTDQVRIWQGKWTKLSSHYVQLFVMAFSAWKGSGPLYSWTCHNHRTNLLFLKLMCPYVLLRIPKWPTCFHFMHAFNVCPPLSTIQYNTRLAYKIACIYVLYRNVIMYFKRISEGIHFHRRAMMYINVHGRPLTKTGTSYHCQFDSNYHLISSPSKPCKENTLFISWGISKKTSSFITDLLHSF